MIKIKISEMLGKHKMTQKELSKAANIRAATISKMYYGEIKRVQIKQMNNLCKVFNCSLSDLFEYVPEK